MTIATEVVSRSSTLRQRTARVDMFALFALALCLALAMLGLVATAHGLPDIDNETPALLGP